MNCKTCSHFYQYRDLSSWSIDKGRCNWIKAVVYNPDRVICKHYEEKKKNENELA